MKILLSLICIVCFLLASAFIYKINELKNVEYHKPKFLDNKKTLIVYYSNGGNTKNVAQNLHSVINGDIKEIKLIEKYPNNVFKLSKIVRKQMKEGYLPKIENIDISNYDVIFIGSPVWNFSLSLPVKTFLKNNDFENKVIIPLFTYSGGGNKKKFIEEIESLTQSKNVKNPLFMFENGIFLVKEQIISWLNNI